jgi:hypothetical protein
MTNWLLLGPSVMCSALFAKRGWWLVQLNCINCYRMAKFEFDLMLFRIYSSQQLLHSLHMHYLVFAVDSSHNIAGLDYGELAT